MAYASATPVRNAPQWLHDLGFGPGDYYCDAKARLEQMMRAPQIPAIARIHACLVLHSAGYQQEMVVRMRRGKIVPMTPTEVCALTGVNARHFRQHMDELELCGLARCDGPRVKNGAVMYAWARPRHVESGKRQASVRASAQDTRYALRAGQSAVMQRVWSDTAEAAMTRNKVHVPRHFVPPPEAVSEIEELARVAEEAEFSLRAALKRLRAQAANKEDRSDRHTPSSSSVEEPTTTGSATDAVPPDAAPDCPTPPEQRIAPDPDDGRAPSHTASVRPSDRTERKRALPRPPQRPSKNGGDRPDGGSRRADVPVANEQNSSVLCAEIHCPDVVAEEVDRLLGAADQRILDKIWRECSRAAPGLTADELVLLVRRSAPKVREKSTKSVHGLLLTDLVSAAGTPRVMQQIRQYLAECAPKRQTEETCVVPELFRRDEPSGSAWLRIQQELIGVLSNEARANWFATCRTLSDEDGVLTIACRDEATVECMTIDYAEAITRAVVTLCLNTCVAFVVHSG